MEGTPVNQTIICNAYRITHSFKCVTVRFDCDLQIDIVKAIRLVHSRLLLVSFFFFFWKFVQVDVL